MSLIKNLRRREVEIFGAKRVVRNDFKEEVKEDVKEEVKEEKPKRKPRKKKGE